MRYLTLNYATGWCWTAVVIRPEQLQNLQMLPDLFLLLQKLLFQRFNLREFILLIVGQLFFLMGFGRLALSGILDFPDDHIDAFLLLVISTDGLQGTGLSRLLLDRRETAHVLARGLWRLGWRLLLGFQGHYCVVWKVKIILVDGIAGRKRSRRRC